MKKPYDQSQVSKNKSNFTLPTSNKANYPSPLKQHGYGNGLSSIEDTPSCGPFFIAMFVHRNVFHLSFLLKVDVFVQ